MATKTIKYFFLMVTALAAGHGYGSGYTVTKCLEGISISRAGKAPEKVVIQKSGHLETENPFQVKVYSADNELQEVDGLKVEFLKSSVFDTYTRTNWGTGLPAQMDITVIASKMMLTANEPIWWELQGDARVAVKEKTVYTMCHEIFNSTGPGHRRL